MTIDEIINGACQCIVQEAASYPSLGLVSKVNAGCHADMNYQTFVASSEIFMNYLHEINDSFDQIKTFFDLRAIGYSAQLAMFKKTNGINTHKGLIFAFGIYFYTFLLAKQEKVSFNKWPKLIKQFVQPLVNDFNNGSASSNGLTIYKKYRIEGARGEALKGYRIINCGIAFLEKMHKKNSSLKENELIFLLLLFYYGKTSDTTVINKIGLIAYQESRKRLKKLLRHAKSDFAKATDEIEKINQWAIDKRISPGGCADLVVLTLFIWRYHFNRIF